MPMKDDQFPPELESLFASYRGVYSDLDAGRNFMPGVWARIEQRQSFTYSFRRVASAFVTAAAALCLVISAAMYYPSQASQGTPSTYIDVLADEGAGDDADFDQAS
jgi:hypothetical protein